MATVYFECLACDEEIAVMVEDGTDDGYVAEAPGHIASTLLLQKVTCEECGHSAIIHLGDEVPLVLT